ncbi:flotillin-2-like [Mercenaria mercenaria]|uniref:flotillin-2-like n=1 Tax=Mercenaria mercenaria TaxID=6596 RepID=UPI001E1D68AB|nr:flotillin-2-like [Mercenaria mercenaria]
MGNIHTVGPNEALVISGGCCGQTGRSLIVGGWGWAWWCVTDSQRISLEVMTLNPQCESVETSEGVPVTVTGVAQCKIMRQPDILKTACEQFLGKSVDHIQRVILQTLEGHLRAILGTLSVEAIYQDRDQFAQLVREVASPDVGKMGIEILSFTIKDIYDNVEYLSSLGRAQTANVKRDADIGVAEANRDAGIREAECEKLRMDAKYSADTKIADSKRMFEMQKAAFDMEVNARRAESRLAYELQSAKERQKIRAEEIEIDVVERKKLIDIEEKEILRKEKELMSTVKRPAEAQAYKVETIAEGQRTQTVEVARAEAEKIRLIGGAEATSIEAVGKAEAERMRLKASAYKQYGDAAMLSLVLETLPKIAAEVSAPLSRTDEIVLVGDDRTTSEVSRLISQLPPAVQALTGVDLSKVLTKVPGAQTS